MYTFDSFAIGIGSSHIAMINALFDAVIVRLPLSWLFAFPLRLGFPGICLGQALSSLLPAIFGFCYFKSSKWERKTSAAQQGKTNKKHPGPQQIRCSRMFLLLYIFLSNTL